MACAINIKAKNDVILPSLYDFFKKKEHIDCILPIISGTSTLSIRVLDWFVTNYAKTFNIILETNFNVYLDYKSQLRGYKKKMFDPFCRKRRIPFYYMDGKCIITTIGQLNFFKWAIQNKIIDYVINHLNDIYQNMNLCSKNKSISSSTETSSDKNKSYINIYKTEYFLILD